MKNLTVSTFILVFMAAPAWAGNVIFFSDQSSFEAFNINDGKTLKGVEDFEESTIPDGGKLAFPSPLQNGVPNIAFPNGINATNLLIQDNDLPGPGAPVPHPSGNPQALFATGLGFAGSNSKKVGEDMGILFGIHVSTDLIFNPDNGIKTGVGFELSRYAGFEPQPGGPSGFVISVFDINNILVGQLPIGEPGSEPNKTFFGVWADSIGRINIHDNASASPEGIDNIQMWVPEPGALSLLLLGGVFALRRRR